ncbi:MAG: hypothetical protein HY922_03495 [Elusimicrobia bacterium]|nr:hypothetical protein [Elusimicrobiota bacterium]
MIGSASRVAEPYSVIEWYQTSCPVEDDAWGQPPASNYRFVVENNVIYGQLIAGTYAPASPELAPESIIDPELEQEFAAWEAASDEDLLDFESK